MSELLKPFVRGWDWIERSWGFPGQAFVIVALIMTVIAVGTWVGNRK